MNKQTKHNSQMIPVDVIDLLLGDELAEGRDEQQRENSESQHLSVDCKSNEQIKDTCSINNRHTGISKMSYSIIY